MKKTLNVKQKFNYAYQMCFNRNLNILIFISKNITQTIYYYTTLFICLVLMYIFSIIER